MYRLCLSLLFESTMSTFAKVRTLVVVILKILGIFFSYDRIHGEEK